MVREKQAALLTGLRVKYYHRISHSTVYTHSVISFRPVVFNTI